MEKLIRRELFKYGFLPLLLVLEQMEKWEEYEVCTAIVNVIKEHSEIYEVELPTKFDAEAIAQMKIYFMSEYGLSGDIAEANSKYYAIDIIKDIQKELNKKQ
jgi:hypothetical protein